MSAEIELQTKAVTLKTQALSIKVTDPASYEAACEMLKVTKSMEKTIIEHFKPLKQAIDASKKVILDQEKAALYPVQEADGIVRTEVTTYLDAEEDKRLAAEAEQTRLNNLAAEKEREKLLSRAANAKTEEKQEELLEKAEAVYAAPVAVAHAVDKTVGGVTRKLETVVTVTDVRKFLMAMLAANHAMLMVEIKPGPLKIWVTANCLEKFDGLLIEKKAGIAVRS